LLVVQKVANLFFGVRHEISGIAAARFENVSDVERLLLVFARPGIHLLVANKKDPTPENA